MAFPADPLDVLVQVGLGADLTADPSTWDWTDATSLAYSRNGGGISLKRGRPNEATVADPCEADMEANNRDGNWSSRNPTGPWHGRIRKGTPLRARIRRVKDTFTRTTSSDWGIATSGQVWTCTGGVASNFATTATAGTVTLTTVNVARLTSLACSLKNYEYQGTVSVSAVATGAAIQAALVMRPGTIATDHYRLQLDFGLSGVLSLSLIERTAGTDSTLDTVALSDTYTSNTQVTIKARLVGSSLKGKAWLTAGTEPSGWTVEATDTTLTAAAPAATRTIAATGNTNTNPVVTWDNLEAHAGRYAGFLSKLPPRWDLSGNDRWAPLEARGLLYRLAQGETPERSAMKRAILNGGDAPVAYWPLEDGPAATRAASALQDGPPLLASTDVVFGSAFAPDGSASAVDLSVATAYLFGPTDIPGGALSEWEVEATVMFDPFPSGNPVGNRYTVMRILAPGSGIDEYGIVLINDVFTATTYNLGMYYRSAGQVFGDYSVNPGPMEAGTPYHFHLKLTQSSTTIAWQVRIDGALVVDSNFLVGTLYAPAAVVINGSAGAADPPSNPASVSHVAFWAPTRTAPATFEAVDGYIGELAHVRFARLCAEEGVTYSTDATDSQAMGVQGVKAFTPLIRECEATDQGYLYEDTEFGLVLQSHTERENLDVSLALDYTTDGHIAPPFEPTDDDQGIVNDVEVKRDGGGSARVIDVDPDSELSIANIGRRDESVTYSMETDDPQPRDIAGWRLRRGTFPGYRFPSLSLNLAAAPTLVDDVLNAGLGYRVTIAHPPDDIGPDTIDLIVEGYDETIKHPNDWDITANCSLFGPYAVGITAAAAPDTDPILGRAAPDVCELVVAVNSSATSWSTFVDPAWTVDANDYPANAPALDVFMAGERLTVDAATRVTSTFVAAGTAASGSDGPQTPGLPAGTRVRDLLLIFASTRNSGTGIPDVPDGYERLAVFEPTDNAQVFWRYVDGTETTPTVTFTGGTANETTIAQCAAFRGITGTVVAHSSAINGSQANIDTPSLRVPEDYALVLVFGWREQDWVSVATLAGMTEIGEPDSPGGNNAGIVWDYVIQSTAANIASTSFVVTGGVNGIGRGAAVALRGDCLRTWTVTRSGNGVVKAQTTSVPITLAHPLIQAL